MAQSLSGRAFAVLDGCSPAAVRKALAAGHIVADRHGRFDPKHKRNAAWLQRVKQTERRQGKTMAKVLGEARLDAAVARVERHEFELAVRVAFYLDRAPLDAWLHEHADCLLAALRDFPGDSIVLREGEPPVARYVPLLWAPASEWPAFTVAARAAMAEHIASMGDVHGAIDRALDDAAADWRGHRPERLRGLVIDIREPPATLAQAGRRWSAATASLEKIKTSVRQGSLIARWPAERAVGNLVLGWRNAVLEQFGVRSSALLLVRMGRPVEHGGQWQLFTALQRILAGIVNQAEQQASEHEIRWQFPSVVRPVVMPFVSTPSVR